MSHEIVDPILQVKEELGDTSSIGTHMYGESREDVESK